MIGNGVGESSTTCTGNIRTIIAGDSATTTMKHYQMNNTILGANALKGTVFAGNIFYMEYDKFVTEYMALK